uniref:Uncharacterized protein n=1 Tax=Zea mays TaxID=4577 RepID=B6SMH7_MAIZE|nr:hypothetical protein [Zea mays]
MLRAPPLATVPLGSAPASPPTTPPPVSSLVPQAFPFNYSAIGSPRRRRRRTLCLPSYRPYPR